MKVEVFMGSTGDTCGISVCMATYNGGKFIEAQIGSILPQLSNGDEIIVVDDASQDDTVEKIQSLGDPHIRITRNEKNLGVIKSFEKALMLARNNIIFLSDQDDIWRADKVRSISPVFEQRPEIMLVVSNGELIDEAGTLMNTRIHNESNAPMHPFANLVKNRYHGCMMTFRRDILKVALPFPADIPMHDSWLGLVAATVGRAEYLNQPLVFYRRHSSNVTSGRHGPVAKMIGDRWGLLKNIVLRCRAPLMARLLDHRIAIKEP